MEEVKAYLINKYSSVSGNIEGDIDRYITTEEELKEHIKEAYIVSQLAKKLLEKKLSYLEIQELVKFSESVYQKTILRLKELQPKYRRKQKDDHCPKCGSFHFLDTDCGLARICQECGHEEDTPAYGWLDESIQDIIEYVEKR